MKPGRVSSAERTPPPAVSAPSSSSTDQPACANLIAAARPLGPEPTTMASVLGRSSFVGAFGVTPKIRFLRQGPGKTVFQLTIESFGSLGNVLWLLHLLEAEFARSGLMTMSGLDSYCGFPPQLVADGNLHFDVS